ncbi:hypothetical protein ACFXAW_07165 [Streptomyces sp. NPDC059445]|uniref:hypothetical protein n=1 Tax=Streptomyces sp. NPDC059445 TaxID=3346832 RepID=UPI0036BEFAA3
MTASWDDLLASLGLTPSSPPSSKPARPQRCRCAGTRTAYQLHLKHGEQPCAKSTAANATYLRAHRGGGPARHAPECGTYSGYLAHRKRSEDACTRCLEARRVRDRQAYAARKQAAA